MKVPVLVFPGQSPIALTAIRSLGRKGIPVYVLFTQNGQKSIFYNVVKSSRYIKESIIYDDKGSVAAEVTELIQIAKYIKVKSVLIPVTDKEMNLVSECREYLKDYYYILMPDHNLVTTLLKKTKFHILAQQHGLPVPDTYIINNNDDLIYTAEKINYPCIIKPDWRQEKWFDSFGRIKVLISNNKKELFSNFDKVKNFKNTLLLQEVITGKDENIYCSFAYLDKDSHELFIYICKKLRQSPPYFGNTSIAESVKDESVYKAAQLVHSELKLTGYVSIEFKKDLRDGLLKILEITIGRINRQAGIAGLSGIDIPYIWYSYLTGEKYIYTDYKNSVKWVSELFELNSVPTYLKNRDISFSEWVKSYRNVKGFEIYTKDDMKPLSAVVPSLIIYFLNRIIKKLINKYRIKSHNV